MNERENDYEIEEEGFLDHWSHDEHPLSLMEIHDMRAECYGCGRYFSSGEQAYGCSSKKKCGYTKLLHEECVEMPTKITLSEHEDNQHILILQHPESLTSWCYLCETSMESMGYKCTSSECWLELHMRCAQAYGMMEAVDDDNDNDGRCTIHHPSHPPNDQLRFVEKRSSFKCDACGITGRGKSYICNTCEYWIHERCATLPQTIKREDHDHSLYLSYHVPTEYLKYDYKCEVCNKSLMYKYWIYHCQLCRYAAHIKCAFKIKTPTKNKAIMEENDVIRLPTDNAAEELIRPFVMRQGGEGMAPFIPPLLHHDDDDDDDDDEVVNVKKYEFILHEHELTLFSSSSSHHHHQKENGEEEDSDEDEEEHLGKRSELICDGCITPILSSSSSSSYHYMSCGECKYNLHLACFNMPPRLPSLPLFHYRCENELDLISCPKHKPWNFRDFWCNVCNRYTNGLMYSCSKCNFKADVKCASLPQTIHHAAHPQRPLNLLTPYDITINNLWWHPCAAGCTVSRLDYNFCYADDNYEFGVHARCAMLPATVKSPLRWDKHHPRMPLTYNANINHPGEFYCDECETKMNPKSWMYHCRHCDLSFHPNCFLLTSGYLRNRKMGQEFSIPTAHPHTLTYQILTTKRRCNGCRQDVHRSGGFHCASCNFFICFYYCGSKMDRDGHIQPID